MDEWATILTGDCREMLRTLPAESVQCVCTSPPYFGLRDYGTAKWEGGDEGCDHLEFSHRRRDSSGGVQNAKGRGTQASTKAVEIQYREVCGKCRARRVDQQIGLEESPEAFVAQLVDVFREVRRVLRPDGVLWLNLGDSYYGGGNYRGNSELSAKQASNGGAQGIRIGKPVTCLPHPTLKPKDLIGVPWRVALALQADGWYLRSDIIWAKPNPMPESVTDRPTKAHEYVFLLSKSDRYFYNADAVREPYAESTLPQQGSRYNGSGLKDYAGNGVQNPSDVKRRIIASLEKNGGRNRRTVWEIATQPFPEAHFATYPEELARLCILAGSREGDTVLDPFGGSGTTAAVAVRHGRRAVLCELNPEYVEIAKRRVSREYGLFAALPPVAEPVKIAVAEPSQPALFAEAS